MSQSPSRSLSCAFPSQPLSHPLGNTRTAITKPRTPEPPLRVELLFRASYDGRVRVELLFRAGYDDDVKQTVELWIESGGDVVEAL